MSQEQYYSDVKIIKKPFNTRIKLLLKIFFVIAIVLGCFVGAKYISSALTVGNISNLIVFGSTSIKTNECVMYAVSLGVYDNYEDAEKVALGSTIQGASGFIWESDNKYYVIGNIYSEKDQASKVIENISNTNYKTEILQIDFPKLRLNFDMYDNSDMPKVNEAIEMFDYLYFELYNNSIKFDKGDISHLAVSNNISQLRGELKGIIVNVQNLINQENSKLNIVQNYLIALDEVMDQAILKTIDNTATNYSLKNAIARVVRLKYEMYNNLI